MADLKNRIYETCLSIVKQKITELEEAIRGISESALNETKSSAGDKHETGRAMMQLEQEKLTGQLKEMREQYKELERLPVNKKVIAAEKGSLIETDKGFFFLSIGLGKIKLDSLNLYALSVHSPLGKKLIGTKEKDKLEMNGATYIIKKLN
ncbi:MAG: 3-oxoacyl-ACP synthase [Bacteroidetes bacterium]|nr:3-oxoacyl-ACP synthase [Bacteroidota bacterium]